MTTSECGGRSGWRVNGEGRVSNGRKLVLVAVVVVGRLVEGWVGGERLKDGRQARHVRQSAQAVVSRLRERNDTDETVVV